MNDPTVFLKNEHAALLRQLDFIEYSTREGEEIFSLLRVLERDSIVHFRREDLLLDVLSSKLRHGGSQMKSLVREHESFIKETKNLIEMIAPLNGCPPLLTGPGLKKKLGEFIEKFRAHIRHEESVVYLLAKTRLTAEQLCTVSQKMLAV